MKKVNEILKNSKYKEYLTKLEVLEKDRKFCKHGMNHFMDVARIEMCIRDSLQGLNGIKNNLLMSIYIIVMVVLVNMLVSSNGETILFYIANKSISLESIYYSIASSVMFITVFMWFSCYTKIMTSDKFIYLFGKRFPSLSLIISMVRCV